MRRVLVPLDGTQLAEAILPDAQRFAGPQGELVLVRDASWTPIDPESGEYSEWHAVDETERYLDGLAQGLEEAGVRASAYRLTGSDVALAIDDTAASLHVDMVACSTHGRGPLGRLFLGSIIWKALAQSYLPVLLRHPEKDWSVEPAREAAQREVGIPRGLLFAVGCMMRASEAVQRRILVPLDGSSFAEAALPMAGELATEWKAPLYLAQVVPDPSTPDSLFRDPDRLRDEIGEVDDYLRRLGERLSRDVHVEVFTGSPADRLADAVTDLGITDVVITSHGRTGLKRAIFGSVADELVQRLHCPIVIIPPLAVDAVSRGTGSTPRQEPVLQR